MNGAVMRLSKTIPLAAVLLIGISLSVGCIKNAPAKKNDSQKQSNKEDVQKLNQNDQLQSGSQPALRSELDSYLANFNNATNWTYGERVAGELAGTWISTDGDGHQVVFNQDGQDGAFGEDFNGARSNGLYAVSDDGKIAAFSRCNGMGIGSHFQLNGDLLTGPKGSNPSASWKRVKN